ncbi:hypothetical protein [Litoreibacter arenae]|uniref:Lipoprotein n=1 Tax=Litoreibacter arenae DSM 19593 TaxID=1123360 RepID=S9RKD6_9RHOB|nr:hypothetical protein [Litoreibacter arenae]EPX78580.1 hypothetical protein thalar_02372 [Litoreibacter arenae DSM 19593]
MPPRKLAALTLALSLLSSGVTACEVVPLGNLYDMLAETYLGGPDNMQLQELHVLDLNGDTYLDAYAVTTFWVSGGAKDAGGVLYFEGRDGGFCDLADEMSVELLDPTSLRVTAVPSEAADKRPEFDVSFTGGGKDPSARTHTRFVYQAKRFGFAPVEK